MLQKPKDLTEMIMMDLAHHCAEDPETGAYLVRSDGRRKSGRPRKYWYRAPGMINAKALYAESDDDAIRQIEVGEWGKKAALRISPHKPE